jgi:hypothetical protein
MLSVSNRRRAVALFAGAAPVALAGLAGCPALLSWGLPAQGGRDATAPIEVGGGDATHGDAVSSGSGSGSGGVGSSGSGSGGGSDSGGSNDGASCAACATDKDCQQSCGPAPVGGIYCCDTTSGSCFTAGQTSCPDSPQSIVCQGSPCKAGDGCCFEGNNDGGGDVACSSACPSSDTVQCTAPADCGDASACCATAIANGGQLPACSIAALSTECSTSCTTDLSAGCGDIMQPVVDTLHLCIASSDCSSDPDNPECCNVGGYAFCVSEQVAQLVGCPGGA